MNAYTGAIVTLVLVGACGARQAPRTVSSTSELRAVYTCGAGPVVLIAGSEGAFLLDGAHGQRVSNRWRAGSAEHFLLFTRLEDGRPVAIEYELPVDLTRSGSQAVYDRARGATFKVRVVGDAWRVSGEPSSRSACRPMVGV